MTRRRWLVIVVMVLVGTSALTFATRAYRPDQEQEQVVGLDDAIAPSAMELSTAPVRVAVVVDEVALVSLVESGHVLAIAPKTSPPR